MIPIPPKLALWAAQTALPWLKDNWRNIGLGAGAVFAMLWLRGCGELAACRADGGRSALEVTRLTQQTQTLEGKLASVSTAKAKVVYVHVPGQPCPEVHVDLEAIGSAEASGKGNQAQALSETVKMAPAASDKPLNGLWAGAGYYNGLYFVEIDVQVDRWQVGVITDQNIGVGGKASYKMLSW